MDRFIKVSIIVIGMLVFVGLFVDETPQNANSIYQQQQRTTTIGY